MATTIQQIELPKKARAVDTSGNNNHGQIYSGRALEFDGVSDYLTGPTSFPHSDVTIALWVNQNSDSGYRGLVSRSSGGAASANWSLWWNGGKPVIFIGHSSGGLGYLDITANTKLENNVWYKLVCTVDFASKTGKIYINGILDKTHTWTESHLTDSDAILIGSLTPSANFWDGMLSDAQIWDAAFTQADVTYDYLNPESLALNNSGTALTESNLKLWYPMQDGHRGQQSYILDGANTGAVVELVTNGDFATGSNWSFYNSSLVGEAARINNVGLSGINAYIIQSSILEAGRLYKFECDVISTNGKDLVLENASPANISVGATTVGHKSIYFTQGAGTQLTLKRLVAETDVTVDNVSIKAINDKHHATTVFYGDELIPHTNDRTFAGASNWANAAGDNAFANYDETGSGQLTVTPDDVSDVQYAFLDGAIGDDWEADMVAGRTYRLTYDIHVSAFTKGTLSVGLSTDAVPAVMKAKTDYTATNGTGATATLDFVYVAADHEMITIYAAANTVLTADFDNFSLKEIGVASGWTDADQQLHIPQTALQSYNELAWFDGTSASNGYVDLDTEIATTDNDWSLSFWIFQEDNGQAYSFPFGGTSIKNIALKNNNTSKLHYKSNAGSTYHALSNDTIPYGEWVSIVITATADTSITAYVNGVAQTTNSDMSDTEIVVDQFMNGYSNTLYNILGTINEISYYSEVLTATEVLDLFNDGKAKSALEASGSASLVGYWRNNGLSEWKDLKGSNDGNTSAGVTETILIPQGVDSTRDAQGFIMNKQKSTSCLNLTSKSGGYVRVQDNSNVQLAGTAASWVFWVKLDSLSDGDQKLISKAPSTGNPSSVYQIRTNSQQLLLQIYSGGWRSDARSSFFTSTDWVHVVVTIDGSNNVNFYKNGDVFGSEADIGYAVPANTGGLHIGIRAGAQDSTEFLKGQIDGVLLYNKELDSTEVLRNYNATKGSHRN